MPLFEMLHLLQVISYFQETLQERFAGTYLRHIVEKEPDQLLARGNSCGKFFGSWWLMVIDVLARGGSW